MALVAAAGADVLVHFVMYPTAIDRLVARVPNAAALKAIITPIGHRRKTRAALA